MAPTTFTVAPSLAPFQLSMGKYLEAHPKLEGVAVSAFVFNPEGKLLLVQRAAHDSLPSLWEIPGGACDFEDESLLHAVARELWEESGLRAKSIVSLVGEPLIFFLGRQRRMCKYSFLTEVEDYEVTLDPNEHQAYLWVTEEEARAHRCGDVKFKYTFKEQELAVYEAFELVKKTQS
ncbi:NUDIX hydrolase domain-like protein [Hypoxylon fragiforme]|uniref:NUDIX hydrolase domain-like protein n=1 Tax=Hypoxylon fragiforme TaxID=63214 RepID=UPI0020C5BBA1|nr:NUDIX hydrolase domain-like protein [Hypoxylon fragiforme]KAI2613189.1 NUDIX hydrolase domain-like protein [Hypoxylon fragiforme]